LGFRFLRGSRFLGFLKKPAILVSLVLLLLVFFLVLRGPLLEAKSWSNTVRSLIFEKSIESWKEKPVFGWGTDRNMEVVGESPRLPPLGSHFYYLTILYRYGLVGLILFAAIIGMMLKEIGKISRLAGPAPFPGQLGLYASWAFFMIFVQAAFIVMDFDVVVLFLMWMNWGIIVAIRIRLEKAEAADAARTQEDGR
jgi:O-antigen ligase